MSIRKATIFLLILLALGLWYFIQLSMRLSGSVLATVANYVFMAFVLAIGNARYNRLVNPISLLAPLMLAFTYYNLMISTRQEPLAPMVVISYYLFVVAFVAGCMIPFTPRKSKTVDSPIYIL